MTPYRIIAIDGGGIGGIVPARLLQRLSRSRPELFERADLYAGTSIGGILALALAAGRSPDELVRLFFDRSRDIFRTNLLWDLRAAHGAIEARYQASGIEAVLSDVLADWPLRLLRPVAVTIVELDKPDENCLLTNIGRAPDLEVLARDAARATSAAPMYFPPAEIPAYGTYIDGGLCANNPCILAAAEAVDEDPSREVRVLSIACSPRRGSIKPHQGGLAWLTSIISVAIGENMRAADRAAKAVLKDRYRRLEPDWLPDYEMDDAGKVEDLCAAADDIDLSEVETWLAEHW